MQVACVAEDDVDSVESEVVEVESLVSIEVVVEGEVARVEVVAVEVEVSDDVSVSPSMEEVSLPEDVSILVVEDVKGDDELDDEALVTSEVVEGDCCKLVTELEVDG